jgi:hypothetical protein
MSNVGRGMYYDRKGKPITQDEWRRLFSDKKYQVLKQTKVGDRLVSTVWLGLNNNFGAGGMPIIFETLVLDDSCGEDDAARYSTEAQAMRGHKEFVRETLNKQSALDRINYEINKEESTSAE